MDFIQSRSWMYNRTNSGRADLTDEFVVGVYEFVKYICTLSKYENERVIQCQCKKCKSSKVFSVDVCSICISTDLILNIGDGLTMVSYNLQNLILY